MATRFTQPLAAPASARLNLPPELLEAVGSAARGADVLSIRIRQSSLPFVLANRLDEFSSFEGEVFWIATAIEQLLDVAQRPKRQGITETFVDRLTAAVAPASRGADRRMCEVWARELYGQRSEVHGEPYKDRRWDPGWHAFLGTVAYGLTLRTLLAGEGRYALSEVDEVEFESFPARLARFRARRLVSGEEAWKLTRERVERAHLRRQTVNHLRLLAEEPPLEPGRP